MSLVRITSGVLAGSAMSTAAAVGTTRNAPPGPFTDSWQPEPAQVLVDTTPPMLICSCARKIGLMHFWKKTKESFCPPTPVALATFAGLPRGLEPPPPQLAS